MTTTTPNRAQRRALQRSRTHTRKPARTIGGNMVSAALARQSLDDMVTTERIRIFLLAEGEDCTETLAHVMSVVGTVCEAAHATPGINRETDAWVRVLHGAMRTVMSLCLSGYRWKTQYTMALNQAMATAREHLWQTDKTALTRAMLEARWVAERIENHTIDGTEIAA